MPLQTCVCWKTCTPRNPEKGNLVFWLAEPSPLERRRWYHVFFYLTSESQLPHLLNIINITLQYTYHRHTLHSSRCPIRGELSWRHHVCTEPNFSVFKHASMAAEVVECPTTSEATTHQAPWAGDNLPGSEAPPGHWALGAEQSSKMNSSQCFAMQTVNLQSWRGEATFSYPA